MKRGITSLIFFMILLVISNSIAWAEIVGYFPVDWGMSVDKVTDIINNSQDFTYVLEDFTDEDYRTNSDYYYICTSATGNHLLDGSLADDKGNDYNIYFIFDNNYKLRMIQCFQLNTVNSYYYDLLQRKDRFIKDKNITSDNNFTYKEDWLDESQKLGDNFETMWDYEGYDWAVSLGYLYVTASMATDKTKTDFIFSGEDGTVDVEIDFYDGKYFN